MTDTSNPVTQVAVTVTVDNGQVNIACSPDPVPVTAPNTLLTFNLDTSTGFSFADSNAIELAVPHHNFPYQSWTLSAATATLYDVCNCEETFKYSVTVVDNRSGEAHTYDPEIKNGNLGGGNGHKR